MYSFCLLALCLAGDIAEPAPGKESTPSNSLYYVAVNTDAAPTNGRGLQIVTVRLKIQPTHRVFMTSRGRVEFISPRALTLNLAATTQDPKTKVEVIYPSGHKRGEYVAYGDEVGIQVVIHRAPGDRSPVQGQLDFRVLGEYF